MTKANLIKLIERCKDDPDLVIAIIREVKLDNVNTIHVINTGMEFSRGSDNIHKVTDGQGNALYYIVDTIQPSPILQGIYTSAEYNDFIAHTGLTYLAF